MKRYLKVTGSAILALAVAGIGTSYLPAFADTGAVKVAQPLPQADKTTTADIQGRLASAVDNAMNVGEYEAMVGSFDKATRDRLALEKETNLDPLNSRITQFRKDFKDKYNQDFDLKAVEFNSTPVYRNGDEDHAIVHLSSFPVLNEKTGGPAANKDWANQPLAGDINLTREHMLINNGWRIVIPENVTGAQLREALGNKLLAIDNDRAEWPANVQDGSKAIAGQILATLTQPAMGANVTAENR